MSAPFIRCLPAWRQYSRPVVRLPGPSGPWTLGSLPGTHHTLRCSRGIVAALGDVAHIGERRPMVNVGDAMDPVLQIWVDEGNDDVVVRCEGTLNVATRGVLLQVVAEVLQKPWRRLCCDLAGVVAEVGT